MLQSLVAAVNKGANDMMKNFLNSTSSSGSTSDTSNESPCAKNSDVRIKAMDESALLNRPRSMSVGQKPPVFSGHNGGSSAGHRDVSSSVSALPPHMEREAQRPRSHSTGTGGGAGLQSQHATPIMDCWMRQRNLNHPVRHLHLLYKTITVFDRLGMGVYWNVHQIHVMNLPKT